MYYIIPHYRFIAILSHTRLYTYVSKYHYIITFLNLEKLIDALEVYIYSESIIYYI